MPTRLHPVTGTSDPKRVADVIFVHGLNPTERDTKKHAFGTWGGADENSDFWPKWLAEDLGNVGVWVLEYEAAATAWLGGAMPLQIRAANLLSLFFGEEIGKKPIIFICHSMGGLIIKEVLRRGLTENKTDWVPIADQVRGVVFLSTPHAGANFASFLNNLKTFLRLNAVMADLEDNSANLLTLASWYRDNVLPRRIQTESYCETTKTNGVTVVDLWSGDPQVPGKTANPLDADHSEVAKAADRQAQMYKGVLRFIRELPLA